MLVSGSVLTEATAPSFWDAAKGVSCFGWEGKPDNFEILLGGCVSMFMPLPKTHLKHFGASCALRPYLPSSWRVCEVRKCRVTVHGETPADFCVMQSPFKSHCQTLFIP